MQTAEYIRESLELHLFFSRIMKEHSFFLEVGFTPRDAKFNERADFFRVQFDRFLRDVVRLANGVVRGDVLQSGEIMTPYTLNAEQASGYYAGVDIATDITNAEKNLMSSDIISINTNLTQAVYGLNQRAIQLVNALIEFKTLILSNIISCKMLTGNYPLLIDHIIREAQLYVRMLHRLQSGEEMDLEKEALEQETFWNRIMAEHSKFIRGLLDPTEEDLIGVAENFGQVFDKLTDESKQVMDQSLTLAKLTDDSLNQTVKIRDFKAQGTQGLLECKIKSIITPLLADHVLRESSHYLRLLTKYQGIAS